MSSAFRAPLEAAFRLALEHLETLDTQPVAAVSNLAALRQHLGKPLSDDGADPEKVISEMVHDVAGGVLGSAGGRFFAWVIGGGVPAALAADWLTSAWDQNAAIFACGPAAGVVEEVAGEWLKTILGLPPKASVAFTSGCQMAHATCLAAARNALLARHGWDVERKGLCAAPRIQVFSSTELHGTFERAVRLLGIGADNIVLLPADEHGRLSPASLEQQLKNRGGNPAIVLLQAADLNIGAFDSFETLIPIAHRHGAWVHIDGAFGLWAVASPQYRHLVNGIGGADSWATDGHKWLNVPYDCGYAFVADRDAHRNAMSHRASYLVHEGDARDQIDWNPEWSRRARGFATYAAIRQLGRNGIADLIERCCRHAKALVAGIGSLPGAEVLAMPVLNQGLLRFGDDARTDDVIARINATGEAFFGGTSWRGKRAMRVSVCNWQTNEDDVRRTIAAARSVLAS